MQLERRRIAAVVAMLSAGVCALVTGTVLVGTSSARAQWSGELEARGNYYWERSTRVIAPEVNATLRSPDDVRIEGHYLVDSITSASQAAGLIADVRFTEVRHEGGLGVGWETEVADLPLDLSLRGQLSSEPDYTSTGGMAAAALSLADRNTVLRLGLGYVHDDVGKILRGAQRVDATGRDLSDRGQVGALDSLVVSAGVDQTLTPVMTLSMGYDLGLLYGFQANAYRQVVVAGVLLDERHPEERFRHTLYGRLAYYVRATGTALHALYRAYVDSWDVAALTPEGRIYQELGNHLLLRLRYRYYTQRRANFQAASYSEADTFYTADPKMTAFHSQLFGAQLRLDLDFLHDTFLAFTADGSLDVGVERILNTNRYGNGVIAQASWRVGF